MKLCLHEEADVSLLSAVYLRVLSLLGLSDFVAKSILDVDFLRVS